MQGVKRGLMSNEAGQGTITMPAAAAEAKHPCEQGIISAIGVFLDTHVICTMTGFIVIMAHRWAMEPEAWKAAGTYPKFLLSIGSMTPGGLNELVMILVSVCFCLFAYTCVIGFITFFGNFCKSYFQFPSFYPLYPRDGRFCCCFWHILQYCRL